jgi:hypothetical protein
VAIEDLADELRLGDFEEEAVFEPGVDLEGVAEAHLLFFEAGALGEGLIDELRGEDGVGLLHGVGGGEVVVFAGVDGDAGAGDDPS